MIFPTIHLGGTAGQDLLAENLEAARAINTAIVKLRNAAPNGRDYYVQGPAAIGQAMAEHEHRITLLQGVLEEIREIADNVQEQMDAREARKR